MNKAQIKKGIDLFYKYSEYQNKTIKSTSILSSVFFNHVNIDKIDFIKNFAKHPFTIIRGQIMLTNGFKNY